VSVSHHGLRERVRGERELNSQLIRQCRWEGDAQNAAVVLRKTKITIVTEPWIAWTE
jgi:hypothetical protein